MSQVLASQNVNKAFLYGFSLGLSTLSFNGFTFNSNLAYTYGRFKTDVKSFSGVYEKLANGSYTFAERKVSSKPLDHIPPVIGRSAFGYQRKTVSTELSLMYNGWKRLDQYNADGEDNAQYATGDGMPSWFIVSWNANLQCTKIIQLQLGIENILDRNYRYFASGFSAPGRNFIVSLRANW
jgi:hemoglobin/transferrin/lactoferrin receptor protein